MPYTILVSALVSLATFFGAYHLIPLGTLEGNEGDRFGSTITTIQGSDTLSSSRTVINTNFSNLNTDKLENSAYYSTTTHSRITTIPLLASIGTITTGVWNGTAVTGAYGGTSSTTLSLNQVMLGNGTSGLKTVAGWGTSGQLLTSGGANAVPTWTSPSVDTSIDYTWTGHHNFTATTSDHGIVGGLVPVGSLQAYASSTPPTGWLTTDGSAVSRATYWKLFSVIGTTYGVGDGSTTFNIPDLRGRNILMASTTAQMADSGGESLHQLTVAELAAHTHSSTAGSEGGTGGGVTDGAGATGSTGGDTPHNVLDPYLTAWYIIKY